jgi:hypothetical protein
MSNSEQLSPWRFLSALESHRPADRELINLTRFEELDIVNHMIAGSKVSILYAFSGNGKSSLINAGIVPFFSEKGYAVFRTRPRPPWAPSDPTLAFEECLLREHWLPGSQAGSDALVETARAEIAKLPPESVASTNTLLTQMQAQLSRLSSTPESRGADLRAYLRPMVGEDLIQFVGRIQAILGREVRMLFICDQFEEIFVHFYDTPVLKAFIAQVAAICKSDSIRAQFLFSMREDWVGSMIEFRSAIPDIFSNYYKLFPIRKSKASYALTLPAEKSGFKFDKLLVQRILTDLSDSYGLQRDEQFVAARLERSPEHDPFIELPALQVVAEALWRTREEAKEPFTVAHYESLLPDSSTPTAEKKA